MFIIPYDQTNLSFYFIPSSFCTACQPGTHSKPYTSGIFSRYGRDARYGSQGHVGMTGPARPPGLQGIKGETDFQGFGDAKKSVWMSHLICCFKGTGKNAHGKTWMKTTTTVWSRWMNFVERKLLFCELDHTAPSSSLNMSYLVALFLVMANHIGKHKNLCENETNVLDFRK